MIVQQSGNKGIVAQEEEVLLRKFFTIYLPTTYFDFRLLGRFYCQIKA